MTPWLDDGDVRLYHGDALEQLALMPSESVQCAITSPPFYALRDYNAERQIGLEATLGEWIAALVAVLSELKRVLRSDGTFFLEIGDTYIDKQLAGAPWRLALALQEAGWFLRSDIVWARPNPMPESVTDRPTKAHSYVFLMTKSARYFYDADAIREPYIKDGRKITTVTGTDASEQHRDGERWPNAAGANARSVWTIATEPTSFAHFATFPQALVERCIKAGTSEHGACSECGAPWRRVTEREVPEDNKAPGGTQRHLTPGHAHVGGSLATVARHTVSTLGWKASCDCATSPEDITRDEDWNGVAPSRARIGAPIPCDHHDQEVTHDPTRQHRRGHDLRSLVVSADARRARRSIGDGAEPSPLSEPAHQGCEVLTPSVVPCVVLDPFMGSGTTALVARRLGRHAIGIELNLSYLEISAERLQQLSLFTSSTPRL